MEIFINSCVNNSRFQVYDDRRVVLRAQVDVPAGAEITITYLPQMISNVRRRAKIKRSWYFQCTCARLAAKSGSEGPGLGFLTKAIIQLNSSTHYQCGFLQKY